MRYVGIVLSSFVFLMSNMVFAELPVNPPPSSSDGASSGGDNKKAVVLSPVGDALSFSNGDRLHGNLVSLEKGKIEWRYPKVANNIVFDTSPVRGVYLGKRPGQPSIDNNVILYLTNNDIIPGTLESLDEKTVKISTTYAGELVVPRLMVRQIAFNSSGVYLYRGPTNSKEWKSRSRGRYNSPAKVKNSQLIMQPGTMTWTKATLGDNVEISFEIVNPTRNLRLKFFFFADDRIANSTPNTYMLTVYGHGNYELERYTNNTGTDTIVDASFRPDNSKPMRVTIFVNKTKREFTVFFNGKKKTTRTDNDYNDFAGRGTNLGFANDGGTVVKVRNITVSKWDGKSAAAAAAAANGDSSKAAANDMAFFLNGDRASGHLKTASTEGVVFATEFADLKVPMSRITMVSLAKNKQHMARKRADDAIISLTEGKGRITLSLKSIKDGVAKGTSENFGSAEFKLPALESIRFNIYNAPDEDNDSGDGAENNAEDEFLLD